MSGTRVFVLLLLVAIGPSKIVDAADDRIEFLPYGRSVCDQQLIGYDILSPAINLLPYMPMKEIDVKKVYVSSNGLISLNGLPPANPVWGVHFSFGDTIFPYGTTFNFTSLGEYYYQAYYEFNNDDKTKSTLNNVSSLVQDYTEYKDFTATWALVVTCIRGVKANTPSSEYITFQTIVTTNGTASFTMFNFQSSTLTTASSNTFPLIGYKVGGVATLNVHARTIRAWEIHDYSNTGKTGFFVYTIHDPARSVNNPAPATTTMTELPTSSTILTTEEPINITVTNSTVPPTTAPGIEFLPFGTSVCDQQLIGDDIVSSAVNLLSNMPVRDLSISTAYVSTNGLISLNGLPPPNPIWASYEGFDAAVFPYGTDFDFSSYGKYYYQAYYQLISDENTQNTLNSVSSLVQNYTDYWNFTATWALVLTCEDGVKASTPPAENITFQCIVTTDGTATFAMFNYKSSSLTIASSNTYPLIGFKAGDFLEKNAHARSAEAWHIDKTTGNVGKGGFFVYSLHNPMTTTTTTEATTSTVEATTSSLEATANTTAATMNTTTGATMYTTEVTTNNTGATMYTTETPTNTTGASMYTTEAPTNTTGATMYTTETPTNTTGATMYTTEAPTDTTGATMYTSEAPTNTTGATMYTTEAPTDTTGATMYTTEAPTNTTRATMYTTEAPTNVTGATMYTTEAQTNTTGATMYTTEAPTNATGATMYTTEAQTNTTGATMYNTEAPTNTTEVTTTSKEATTTIEATSISTEASTNTTGAIMTTTEDRTTTEDTTEDTRTTKEDTMSTTEDTATTIGHTTTTIEDITSTIEATATTIEATTTTVEATATTIEATTTTVEATTTTIEATPISTEATTTKENASTVTDSTNQNGNVTTATSQDSGQANKQLNLQYLLAPILILHYLTRN